MTLLLLLWPVWFLLGLTGGLGVLSGFCVHWWLELRALTAGPYPRR